MKNKLLYAISFTVLGWAAFAAVAAAAPRNLQLLGPYYTPPAWDQKLDAPNSRWVVMTDWNSEAVLDKETGLVWDRSPIPPEPSYGFTTHYNAVKYCVELKKGNRMGWRLPTAQELLSLIDTSVDAGVAIRNSPFINVVIGQGYFWTSTVYSNEVDRIFWVGVNMANGGVGYLDNSNATVNKAFTWCVRGGIGVDTAR
jgi:hypothetical protein